VLDGGLVHVESLEGKHAVVIGRSEQRLRGFFRNVDVDVDETAPERAVAVGEEEEEESSTSTSTSTLQKGM
jgi:hypothetical protein